MSSPVHLIDKLAGFAAASPTKPVFVKISRSGEVADQVSFDQLNKAVSLFSAGLSLQVPKANVIALLYDNSFDFVRAFLACLHAGLLPVAYQIPNSPYKYDRMMRQFGDSSIRYVLISEKVNRKSWFRKLADADPGTDRLHWILEEDCCGAETGLANPVAPSDPDAPLYYQFTSGSTGLSKRIPISALNVHQNTEAIGKVINREPGQVHLCWLPHYHDLGLVAGLFLPICFGSTGYLLDPLDVAARPGLWLESISRYRADFSHTPNFGLDMCVNRIPEQEGFEKLDLSSLKGLMVCAEPIRKASLDRFRDRFSRVGFPRQAFVTCYGMAEATLAVTMQALDSPVCLYEDPTTGSTFVSCGSPVAGMTVHIDNASGDPTELGEVVVSGGSVSNVFPETGLHTGDLGMLQDGALYIVGRSKEIIIINGVNHLLHELEYVIEQLPFVQERGALACRTEGTDTEKLTLLLELKRAALQDPDFASMRRQVIRKLNIEFGISPEKILFFGPSVLPKTSSGKKQRHNWRQFVDKIVPSSEQTVFS